MILDYGFGTMTATTSFIVQMKHKISFDLRESFCALGKNVYEIGKRSEKEIMNYYFIFDEYLRRIFHSLYCFCSDAFAMLLRIFPIQNN